MSSIGLLAVAMASALYSSSAGRDGRVAAAAISAFLALGIAIWVGVKFVPRLASHVDWEWLPFLTHYRVTREGWIYFATVTVVVFAAINTANNLLYMVLSALLAVLALSGFLSALNYRFLRVAVRIPPHCYANEPFPVSVQIENCKRLFPSFAISMDAHQDSPFRISPTYSPLIRATEIAPQPAQAVLPRRGRHVVKKLKASSRYPFGFFLKDKNYAVEAECICYPEILERDQVDLTNVDVRGTNQRFERGFGHDLYMIRDYLPSDSTRHVHWKASAKTSTLKTREYAAEESRKITLAFDRFGHPGDIERFERLVSHAASLAYHLIQDGIEVTLVSDQFQGETQESILEYLALVEMSSTAALPGLRDAAATLSLRTPQHA